MSETRCERVRELIPDHAAGRLDAESAALVEAHLPRCPECSAESDLARALYGSRARAPAGLADRVRAAVGEDRGASRRPAWALTAAALAALALGIGVVSREADEGGQPGVPAYVAESEEPVLWMADDGLVAGGLVLEGLSDEALAQLLDELTAGGQA